METDDELENFLRERKMRVAEDKANLEQGAPYMEVKQTKPHRPYGSTVKENIPPRLMAQRKEENSIMGLPLGVEYEKKKKRLQHELRMDYRRYMAQKKHSDPVEPGPLLHISNTKPVKQCLLEDLAGDVLNQRPPSRRDAATLTEGCKGLFRAQCFTERKTLCPEEEEECSSVLPRHHDKLVGLVVQDSEEEGYFKEELELMDGSRHKHHEEKSDLAIKDGRSRMLANSDDVEFATGLIIGAADNDEALQRRKVRYRQELQEQIAEQHRNKKREKDLELKVAATGANDPEKQPDRIRQFGLSRRKGLRFLESSSKGLLNNEKRGFRGRQMSSPDQRHMAFQSPVLECSSALSLMGGGLSPSSQPAALSFPRSMDTPRVPLLPPPPSTVSEAYQSPYGEPQHHYSTRNLLDPNMALYGHPSVPGVGLSMSYWDVLPGQAMPCQFGNCNPHSQHNGSGFPEPPVKPSNEAAATDPHAGPSSRERTKSTRQRILSYREALKQQIQEQQERRRQAREEVERFEAQLKTDMMNHQPWGQGGGGAPLRDSTGNLIADLSQMHKLNEEAYSNPEEWQRKATAAMRAHRAEPSDFERTPGSTQSPQFARGNVFANQPTQQQLQEQDKYKAFLKQQIEEKLRKKAEERERSRLEEEKEEKRLAEQRACIQREYKEEQEKKKRKEMEQKAKNEELIELADQRKKEAERKKKAEEEKENAALRRQYEREKQVRMEEVHRQPSPPIPTLQKTHGRHKNTSRPPTVESEHSSVSTSVQSLSGLQSPPVPACRNQLRAAGDQQDVFIELSLLRRQLRSEQKRLEDCLQQGEGEELDSSLSDRQLEHPQVDVFDMARLGLQAPVQSNSRNMKPRNQQRMQECLQLNYTDGESRPSSSEVPKVGEVGVAQRRLQNYKDSYHQLSGQRTTVPDDYFDLSVHQNSYLRSVLGESLLESESAFIDPLGDVFPVPQTPVYEKVPQLTARERRRLAKKSQHCQEQAASNQPIGQRGNYSAHTGSRLQQEAESIGKGRRSNRAEPVDLAENDPLPPQFSPYKLKYQSSVETVFTDPWIRPGTSKTVKCSGRPLKREQLTT